MRMPVVEPACRGLAFGDHYTPAFFIPKQVLRYKNPFPHPSDVSSSNKERTLAIKAKLAIKLKRN